MNGKLAACVKWRMHYALEEDERDETPATPPLHHPINNCHPNTTTSINMDIRTALSAPAPVPAIHARLVCHASPNTLFGAASHRPQRPNTHPIPTLDFDPNSDTIPSHHNSVLSHFPLWFFSVKASRTILLELSFHGHAVAWYANSRSGNDGFYLGRADNVMNAMAYALMHRNGRLDVQGYALIRKCFAF
jgi:hypothetical protein